MCGVFDSALGLAPEPAIRRFRTGLPTRFESVKGPVRLSEVEAEQKEILKIARRLADEGQIAIGGGGGDAVV